MQAPRKIYRTTTYLDNDKGKTVWKGHPVAGAENVEYIRKDAFIKKACDWLKNNVEKYYYLDEAYDKVINVKNLNKDFKTYMEG